MRCPPSALFMFKTAWAVVPEPAKESRINASGSAAIRKTNSIRRDGFGVSKVARPSKIASISFFASSVCPVSACGQKFVGKRPPTFSRYVFLAMPPFPPFVKKNLGCPRSKTCFASAAASSSGFDKTIPLTPARTSSGAIPQIFALSMASSRSFSS